MWIINKTESNFDNKFIVKIEVKRETRAFVHFRGKGQIIDSRIKKKGLNFCVLSDKDAIEYLTLERRSYTEGVLSWKILGNKISQILNCENAPEYEANMLFQKIANKNF
jgi:hypothetical protein